MKSREPGGFILMEVLLAATILVTGVVLVAQSFRSSLRHVRESRQGLEAALLIEGQMAVLQKTGRTSDLPSNSSVLGTLSWKHEQGREQPYGREHRLVMSWGEGRRGNRRELSTLLAR